MQFYLDISVAYFQLFKLRIRTCEILQLWRFMAGHELFLTLSLRYVTFFSVDMFANWATHFPCSILSSRLLAHFVTNFSESALRFPEVGSGKHDPPSKVQTLQFRELSLCLRVSVFRVCVFIFPLFKNLPVPSGLIQSYLVLSRFLKASFI